MGVNSDLGNLIYHHALLSSLDLGIVRSPGPGLGNLLFPISRALIGQALHGGEFVYPTMRQVKVGTFLRGEPDKRTYGRVLRARTHEEWRTWVKARQCNSVDECQIRGTESDVTVLYQGLGNFFHDLAGHRDLIADWLTTNVLHRQPQTPADIALHIRWGDFGPEAPGSTKQSVRLPLDWYREAYRQAIEMIGDQNPRVILFTDEHPERVRRLLGIDGMSVDQSPDALNAILNLSRARCVIASRSTFSMWGVFLGNSLGLWPRQFDLAAAFPIRTGYDHFV